MLGKLVVKKHDLLQSLKQTCSEFGVDIEDWSSTRSARYLKSFVHVANIFPQSGLQEIMYRKDPNPDMDLSVTFDNCSEGLCE